MTESEVSKHEEIAGDLVVALLSVNLWTIEKTFKIYDGLKREGLFDRQAVAEMKPQEVFDRLERAGYTRGDFMIGLVGERLMHLANALAGDGMETLRGLVEAKDSRGLEGFLSPVKGVGPQVLAGFRVLRGIEK